ncbi:hypothetical protein [Paenarthrobacter sp. NCHU4564]|uniref:hypothetical protein n=1 Tax=Paenarthrobacter sp. NCHU4564 TaxID=3451353 RepID=UPI003F9C9B2E
MEKNLCKKCNEVLEDQTARRCEECKTRKRRKVRTVSLAITAALAATVAAAIAAARPNGDKSRDEDPSPFGSDSSRADEMGISLSDYRKLSEAIDGGKISHGWANAHTEAIRDGWLTAGEVIYFGSGTDDDD